MHNYNHEPVFIVGCARSGTTLLRLILNRHPNIAIPEETWYYPQLYKELLQYEGDNWRERVNNRILELNQKHYPALKSKQLEKSLESVEWGEVPKIISTVNREFANRENKPRWGDKTPGYTLHLPLLKKLFPQAKIIHIIRDARDVVSSILNHWEVGPQTINFIETVCYWKKQVNTGRKDGLGLYGNNYKEVKYEELVVNPKSVVSDICEFINEEYDPHMLLIEENAKLYVPEWEHHSETKSPINKNQVAKWQKLLNKKEIALINLIAANLLKNLGYQLTRSYNLSAIFEFITFRVKTFFNAEFLIFKVAMYNLIHIRNGQNG